MRSGSLSVLSIYLNVKSILVVIWSKKRIALLYHSSEIDIEGFKLIDHNAKNGP